MAQETPSQLEVHVGATWQIRLNDLGAAAIGGCHQRRGDAACSQIILVRRVVMDSHTGMGRAALVFQWKRSHTELPAQPIQPYPISVCVCVCVDASLLLLTPHHIANCREGVNGPQRGGGWVKSVIDWSS